MELSTLIALAGCILTPSAYNYLKSASDQYLIEVEDEAASTLRNNSIFLLGELLLKGKQAARILKEYTSYVLLG